jgi:hypothetical protein
MRQSGSGKMHDSLQIALVRPESRWRGMTERLGRFGRMLPTGCHSPGSVTGMEAD